MKAKLKMTRNFLVRKYITSVIFISTVFLGYVYASMPSNALEKDSATLSSPTADAQVSADNKKEVVEHQEAASENKVEVNGESEANEEKHLFLWKAIRGKQTVYLLGTIHIVKSNFYPIPDAIENAFTQSQELFVECIPDRTKIQSTSKLLNEKRAYKNGDKLYNHLSAGTKRVFEEYLDWAGEPMEIYESYRPSQVSGLIGSDAVRRYGLKVPGLDMYFINKAKQTHKKVTELESVDFQLNLLSSFSEAEQDAELLSALLDLKDIPNYLDGIMSAWREGDPVRLEQMSKSSIQDMPELKAVNEKIITARNLGMADKLEDCLKDKHDGTYFLAVGAAHLVGDHGLPALLAKKGFSVSQMSVPKEAPKTSFGAHKLEKLYYPEGKFSILLPGPAVPSVYGSINGMRSVEYTYPTFAGTYVFGYIMLPESVSDPAKVQAFYNAMGISIAAKMSSACAKSLSATGGKSIVAKETSSNGTSENLTKNKTKVGKTQILDTKSQVKVGPIFQSAVNVCNRPGREIRAEITKNGKTGLIRVRLVIIDRFIYMMIVAGSKAWADSVIVNEFMTSLSVRK